MSFPVIVEAHKTYHLHGMNPKRFYDIVVSWECAGWPGQVKIGDLEIDALMRHPWDVHGRITSPDNEIAHYSGSLVDVRHTQVLKLDVHIESFVNVEEFWNTVWIILENICTTDVLWREERDKQTILAQHKGETDDKVNAD